MSVPRPLHRPVRRGSRHTPTRHGSSSASSTRDQPGDHAPPQDGADPPRDRRHRQLHPHPRRADVRGPDRLAQLGPLHRPALLEQPAGARPAPRRTTPSEVAAGCVEHLREATRGGRIRSTITVFAPDRPGRPGPRIHNEQLIRYAGHRTATGGVRGDGRYVGFTDEVTALGWQPPDAARPVRRAAAADLRRLGRTRPAAVRPARRRGARGPAEPSRPPVVRRAAAALARRARDQQHAAGDRRRALPGRPVQRVVSRHRDRRPQPRRRRPLRPAAGGRRAAGPGHQLAAHAVARPRARRARPRRPALVRRGRASRWPTTTPSRSGSSRTSAGRPTPGGAARPTGAGSCRPVSGGLTAGLPPLLRRTRPRRAARRSCPPDGPAARTTAAPARAPSGCGRGTPRTDRVAARRTVTSYRPERPARARSTASATSSSPSAAGRRNTMSPRRPPSRPRSCCRRRRTPTSASRNR